jgi:hypothetical protein
VVVDSTIVLSSIVVLLVSFVVTIGGEDFFREEATGFVDTARGPSR